MTLLDYFNMIVKHWKVVLISVFVCTFMGFAACFIIPKVYEANGKLLISQDNMSILGGGSSPLEDMMLSSLGKSDPLTTQMEILKTRPILFKVIDSLHLIKNGVLLEPDKFIKNFKISVVRSTNLIQVECRYSNADSAALIVNTLMQVFVDKNQQMNQ